MGDANAPGHRIGAPQRDDRADAVISRLAGRQHGVVSRTQLLAAGVSRRQIQRRLHDARLHRIHRGVYAAGHDALAQEGIWMAAVLAGGEGTALSHWSTASLCRMRPGRGPRSHVTSPRNRRNSAATVFHHGTLPPDEVTVVQGTPVTTPARTLLDLAPLLPSPTLGRMIDAAPPHPGASLAELLDRYPRRWGAPKLRPLLRGDRPLTRSDFEAHILHLIERAGLRRPDVNVVVAGHEVDLVWRRERVVAEIDTYVTHGSRLAFERDRERDRTLAAAGWRVVRITDSNPRGGVTDLSRVLAAGAGPRKRPAAVTEIGRNGDLDRRGRHRPDKPEAGGLPASIVGRGGRDL